MGVPVYDFAPEDAEEQPHHEDEAEDTQAAPQDIPDHEGPDQAFHPSYNLAPRYRGLVLRNLSTKQARESRGSADPGFAVQLQVMQWGLLPSWAKRRPDYASTLKTINCRSDSLAAGGMWSSMRGRKRCVVVAQGFYEWLKVGPKERVPHYIRRHDGRLLLLAGLWDAVDLNEHDIPAGTDSGRAEKNRRKQTKTYTYTIVTTGSNDDMRPLHDRMPVIFDADSPALRMWLDPARTEWSPELQSLLKPWPSKDACGDASYLDIDVVGKDVNKVGYDSPSLILPVASHENKANIANFFVSSPEGKKGKKSCPGQKDSAEALSNQPHTQVGASLATSSILSKSPKAIAGSKRSAPETPDDESSSLPSVEKEDAGGKTTSPKFLTPTKSPVSTDVKSITVERAKKRKKVQTITSYFHPKD